MSNYGHFWSQVRGIVTQHPAPTKALETAKDKSIWCDCFFSLWDIVRACKRRTPEICYSFFLIWNLRNQLSNVNIPGSQDTDRGPRHLWLSWEWGAQLDISQFYWDFVVPWWTSEMQSFCQFSSKHWSFQCDFGRIPSQDHQGAQGMFPFNHPKSGHFSAGNLPFWGYTLYEPAHVPRYQCVKISTRW